MKITKKVLPIIIILLVVTSVSIIVLASIDKSDMTTINVAQKPVTDNSIHFTRADAKKQRVFTQSNGDKITLTYVNSIRTEESYKDVYVDENKSRYSYDSDGNLLSLLNSGISKIKETEKTDVSKEQAVVIGKDYAKKTFGEIIDGMVVHDVLLPENNSKYIITLAKTYGDEGAIVGESCVVMVKPNGDVSACSLLDSEIAEDFDPVLLEGVSVDVLTKFATERTESIIPSITKFSIDSDRISICKRDGKYAVEVISTQTSSKALDTETAEKYDVKNVMGAGDHETVIFHYYPLEK